MRTVKSISKNEISKLKEQIEHLKIENNKINTESEKFKKEALELKTIEKKYHEIDKHLQRIFEESAIGMGLTDLKGKFIQVNPAFCRMLGYSKKELISKLITDITYSEDIADQLQYQKKLLSGKIKSYQFQKRYVRKDGKLIWVLLSSTMVNDSNGKPLHIIGQVQDTTEKVNAEEKLKESEERFRMIFEKGQFGLAISDSNYKFIAANPAFCQMMGYSAKELSALTFADITPPLQRDVDTENVLSMTKGKINHYQTEKQYLRKDGTTFWGSLVTTPVHDYEGKIAFYIAMVQDISERKRLEKELLHAKEKAELADKLKTAFLCNMSHEIRTPMNAIMGFAELIENNELLPEKRMAYAKTINHRANDLLNIINDIIDVSKIESGTLNIIEEPGFLNIVLDEIKQFFKTRNENLIKKPIEFIVHNTLKSGQNKILCDFQRLKQVLINLAENALKFTYSGFIEIGCELIDDKKNILIYVKDTGIGIPKNKQSLIFDRFRQVDEALYGKKSGGAGLGLSISKGLIELMKGKLWVESEEGKGSVFYFTIPYKVDKNGIEPLIKENHINYNWKDKSILLVEDTEYNADVISEILSSTGVNVKVAKNGSSAIEQFQKNPDFDLILMDIRLPDISGLDVTRKIKKLKKNIPVIAQTAYASDEDKIRCIESGCQEFISKPINYNNMLKVLNKYLL